MHAVTDIGYQLVEGLHFKNQSLLVLGKIYSDLGGALCLKVELEAQPLELSRTHFGGLSQCQWQ